MWDAKLFLKGTWFNKMNIFIRISRIKHDISRIQMAVSLAVSVVSIRATMAAYIIRMANILGGNSTRISHVACTIVPVYCPDYIYIFHSRGCTLYFRLTKRQSRRVLAPQSLKSIT